jgi:hypothetical protein
MQAILSKTKIPSNTKLPNSKQYVQNIQSSRTLFSLRRFRHRSHTSFQILLPLLRISFKIPITLRLIIKHLLLIIQTQHPLNQTRLPLQFILIRTAIISRPMTSIRDMESLIHSDYGVESNDNNLDCEVEDVEACFGVVPSRIIPCSWDVGDSCSESCSEGEDCG